MHTYVPQGWTDFCESSGAASGDPFVPFDFIASFFGHRLWRHSFLLFGHRQWPPLSFHITASFLWAPPVATQFSFLSYSELYVRAPSVATLLCHLSSSPHLSGLRLWRLSFLFCNILHTYTHADIHIYIHTYIHTYTKQGSQLANQPPSQPDSQPSAGQVPWSYVIPLAASQPASLPAPWSQFCLWVHRLPGRDSACWQPPWS